MILQSKWSQVQHDAHSGLHYLDPLPHASQGALGALASSLLQRSSELLQFPSVHLFRFVVGRIMASSPQ